MGGNEGGRVWQGGCCPGPSHASHALFTAYLRWGKARAFLAAFSVLALVWALVSRRRMARVFLARRSMGTYFCRAGGGGQGRGGKAPRRGEGARRLREECFCETRRAVGGTGGQRKGRDSCLGGRANRPRRCVPHKCRTERRKREPGGWQPGASPKAKGAGQPCFRLARNPLLRLASHNGWLASGCASVTDSQLLCGQARTCRAWPPVLLALHGAAQHRNLACQLACSACAVHCCAFGQLHRAAPCWHQPRVLPS